MLRLAYILLLVNVLALSNAVAQNAVGRLMRVSSEDRMPLVGINALIQDHEGYVWYATTEGGLCRDNGYQIDVFRNDRHNTMRLGHSNGVLSLCETENGDICFGTRENIYILRKSDYSIIPLDSTIQKGKVYFIERQKNGELKALTGSGLCTFDRKGVLKKIVPVGPLTREEADSIGRRFKRMTDSRGREWTILDNEIYVVHADNSIRRTVGEALPTQSKVAVTPMGIVYTGDSAGITITCGSEVRRIDKLSNIRQILPFGEQALYISAHAALAAIDRAGTVRVFVRGGESKCFTIAPDRKVWIGGWHGEVWCYSGGHLQLDEAASTENSDPVNGLVADGNGMLWILTDRRIKVYNPSTGQCRILLNHDDRISITRFDEILLRDGKIIVYGSDGSVEIDASIYPLRSAVVAHLALTAVDIDGHTRYTTSDVTEVDVPPTAVSTELFFSTFDHPNAGIVQFSYSINGGEWLKIPLGQNSIRFVSLSKGDYHIRMRAADALSWTDVEREFVVHRLPAWWETWWAYTLYALLALVVAVFLDRSYVKYRAAKRQLKELQRRMDEFLRNSHTHVEQLPDEMASSEEMHEFIVKAIEKVEQHLDDSEYNVSQFAADLCMSRATLYRMFSDTTGQKPLDFMRSIRLKRAAELLNTRQDLSVQSIALMTGFASISNFTKRFREKFGCNPSEMRS